MNLTELRKLVSKLNKDDRIVGVWKMKRPQIEEALAKVRYRIDDEAKKLIPVVEMKRKKIISMDKVEKKKSKILLKPPKELVKSTKPEKSLRLKKKEIREWQKLELM